MFEPYICEPKSAKAKEVTGNGIVIGHRQDIELDPKTGKRVLAEKAIVLWDKIRNPSHSVERVENLVWLDLLRNVDSYDDEEEEDEDEYLLEDDDDLDDDEFEDGDDEDEDEDDEDADEGFTTSAPDSFEYNEFEETTAIETVDGGEGESLEADTHEGIIADKAILDGEVVDGENHETV